MITPLCIVSATVTQHKRTMFLKEAEVIGAKICRSALWSGRECYWQDNFMERVRNEKVIIRRPIGLDLYFGSGGITVFLAGLYALAPEKLYRTTAEGSAKLTLRQIENLDSGFPIGFYVGYAGIVYALIQVGELLGNEHLIARALKMIRWISERETASQGLD